ncbi:MAG TPA: tRNA uridine-5-carboxymethylaminomethyl(34) synthesis GTPase MnmE [Dongiaceae bacterium]|nr:tRNA uridine-5-carboxymethylaminomethyl(34) synthesis GTPase MnmE [Dongiaceae bacterium]
MKATIFALATAPGKAPIAVVRVSGPQARAAIRSLTGRDPPPPRQAGLRRLSGPHGSQGGERIDDALVLWFPGPRSETGEDMAEFHLHGGRAVVAATLAALAAVPGLSPAGRGAFTRQAFDNGKLDLTAAEAIADLVEAETAAQQRQALRQMDGALAKLYEGWRTGLLALLARLEAAIDFPEEDLPAGVIAETGSAIAALREAIAAHLGDRRGERLREGLSIALLGAPNAGKSSLLNYLAGRAAAIVSARAGTTRDVIEVHLDIAGFPVVLADTAGLREVTDEIEAEGVRRARDRAERADLKLIVLDGAAWPAIDPASAAMIDDDSLVLVSKADLDTAIPAEPVISGRLALAVSVVSGQGADRLLAALQAEVTERMSPGEAPALTRFRHRQALEECLAALDRARDAALPELCAEDLRLASRALGRITGRVDVEEILDRIFSEFCIGK